MNQLSITLVLQALWYVSSNIRNDLPVPPFVKTLISSGICQEGIEKAFYHNNHDEAFVRSKQHRSNMLQTAVCFHSYNRLNEALDIYNHLRWQFPDFAFPLVNIALIDLKNGHSKRVADGLDLYFEEVGGIFGNKTEMKLKDSDAQMFGSPCVQLALYRIECVNALNFYGIAQVELYNYDKAMESYERAIEIGHDVEIITDVHQNIGTLFNTMGRFDEAADSFLRSFWSSVKIKNEIDPSPLLQRAMLIPSISSSIEESITYKECFEDRLNELMTLIQDGGTGWVNNGGDLFKVQDGVSSIEDIQALQVSLVGSTL